MDFDYPRPNFKRDGWLSLNGSWSFSDEVISNPEQVRWTQTIEVPFPPESPRSGLDNRRELYEVVWYQREFELPEAWREKRILLHFGAVDYRAEVWVNGRFVISHEGGHTPFTADITDQLEGERQTVTVRAEDDPHALDKPRGKQDWQPTPHRIWYPRTTGIWQSVWLEPVSPIHLTSLHFTPKLSEFAFGVEVQTNTFQPGLSLEFEVTLGDTLLARTLCTLTDSQTFTQLHLQDPGIYDARNPFLWSPESPTLLDVRAVLKGEEEVLDTVHSYTALRSVDARGGTFHLNGNPYFLRLALDQGYWPESHLAAPSGGALKLDVELAKELGFNGVRKHQKVEDPRYLYWADRLGLLVWEELPSAYRFSKRSVKRLTQEWLETIERDYSHPCIVTWVAFNESWGLPDLAVSEPQQHFVSALYHLTKTLDPTRPVVGNDGWEHVVTDLLTIHDYHTSPDVLQSRYGTAAAIRETVETVRPSRRGQVIALGGAYKGNQPVILSEFGGIKLRDDAAGWGYDEAETPEAFLKKYQKLVAAASSPSLTGFCYTQFADTFQEKNGLLFEDRTPKASLELLARATRNGR